MQAARTVTLPDIHASIIILVTIYFVLVAVLNGALAVAGAISFETYVSSHTLVFVNIVFGFLYLLYAYRWKGQFYFRYENTDLKKFALFAAAGALIHTLSYMFFSGLLSVSTVAIQAYTILLGSAYALVAFTENAFFIGVIGDYIAERFNYTLRGKLVASVVAGIAAGLAASVFHIGVYGGSPLALAVVAFWFGYWTFASLEMRSTLYADFHHAIGNYFGFVWSAVEVIA